MPPVSVTFNFETAAEAAAFLEARTGRVAVSAPEAPVAAPKAPRTRAAPAAAPAPVAAPVAAPAPAAAPAKDLKKQAIAAVVKLINANDALGRNGKQVCTDLCNSFGGANISKIDPAKYQEVIAAAEEALEALNSDPAA